MMEVSLVEGLLLLSLLGFPLMYLRVTTVKYCCKVVFLFFLVNFAYFWIILLCAHKGRNVDNMRIHNKLLAPIKYFLGIRFKLQGLENLPNEDCYVMVANHQEYLDIFGCCFSSLPVSGINALDESDEIEALYQQAMSEFLPPRCVPIAKKEFRFIGLFGLAFWLCGYFFIDREQNSKAVNTMLHIQKTMVAKKFRIFIFPEGTRNYSTSMLPFKHGAFHLAVQSQVPIVPVVISSYRHFFSKMEKKFTEGECTIQILPKVETQGLKADSVPELIHSVRDTMLKVFYQISEEVKQ